MPLPTLREDAMKSIFLAALALLLGSLAARAETALRIAMVSRTIFYLPAWTAEKQGFFQAAGIEPKFEIFDGGGRILADLRSGSHQIGITSIENVIAESHKGSTLRVVAGSAQRPPHFIIAQPEIKTLADLKGTLIGVASMQEGTH